MKNKGWNIGFNICDNIIDNIWNNRIYDYSIKIFGMHQSTISDNIDVNVASNIRFHMESSILVKISVKRRILNNINDGKHIS